MPDPTAEGAYAGRLTGSTADSFNMVVLETGEFWTIYGNTVGNTLFVAGFIQGTGTSSDGAFTVASARDYSLGGTLSPSISATYVAGTSAQGTVTYPGLGTVGFSGTTAAIAPYDYTLAAKLSDIVGTWNFTGLDGSSGVATINSGGAFRSDSGGCISTGTLTPRASGKNVFNVTLSIGTIPCAAPGTTGKGIAIYSPIAGTAMHQLIVGTVSDDRTMGNMVFGAR